MGTKMVENRRNEEKIAKGNNSLNPNLFASCSFEDLGLHPTLCDLLRERMKFKVPTAIQAQAIPAILSGRHVGKRLTFLRQRYRLVNAATGTGKTIVYLAPIIHHLQMHTPRIKRADGTFGTYRVSHPSQVYEILQNLLHRFHWIVPGYVMGGENRSKEKARLRKGISILIATPGRLLDHLKHTSSFVHNKMRWVIFDEADRILELGFGKDIEEILDVLGTREPELDTMDTKAPEVPAVRFPRQNLLLSATLNEKVNHLAKISLDNPSMIGLEGPANHRLKFSYEDSDSLNSNAPATHSSTLQSCSIVDYKLPAQLVQKYVKVTCGSRFVALLSSLKFLYGKEASQKVVVFFSTCDGVDFHFSLFSKFQSPSEQNVEQKQAFLPCKVLRLHGSMEQEDRRMSFQSFNSERSAILLCTDVAARGLDFPKVRYIIQYDSPGDAIEYIHRVGRTARLGEKGVALVFLLATELDYLRELKKHGVTLDEFPIQKVLGSFPIPGGRKHKKSISIDSHPWVMHLQKSVESFILAETELKSLAKEAFCSWVRAYTAHRGELKQVFMVKKLHLGHVARSFGLREQPSLVGRSFQLQMKKRKEQKKGGMSKKRRVVRKPETAGRG